MRVLYVSAFGGAGLGRAAQRYFPLEAARLGVAASMIGEGIADELSGRVEGYAFGPRWRKLGTRLADLRKVVRDLRPDIVHVFRHIDCELYPLLCGAGAGATWLVDARTPILANGLARLPSLLSGWASGRTYHRRAAHAASVGRYVFGRRDVVVLPPGYDDALFHPVTRQAGGVGPPVLRLVYIGSLGSRRRIVEALEMLVRAAPDLAANGRRLEIDVYGEGAEDGSIRALVARAPIVIRHAGAMSQAKLAAKLRDYDVGLSLILNPVYREAPPLKTIEYLASGLPVIATATPGNRHFVRDGVNGWLIDEGHETLRDLVQRLCRDGVPSGMGERAAASVRGLSWREIAAERLLPLYESCVSARRSTPSARAASR